VRGGLPAHDADAAAQAAGIRAQDRAT